MENVTVKFINDGNEPAAFNLYQDNRKIGEMIVEILDGNLKVYHTEVDEDQSGKGYSIVLMNSLVDYCKNNSFKVIPLCSYVAAQFNRHPEKYNEIWNQEIEPKF